MTRSMRGSGIYTEVRHTPSVTCDECGWSGDMDVVWDDYDIGHFECPECSEESVIEPPEPDPDETYERLREQRMWG